MNIVSIAVGVILSALLAVAGSEYYTGSVLLQQQKDMVAQLKQIQQAMSNFESSVCTPPSGSTAFSCSETSFTLANLQSAAFLPTNFTYSPLFTTPPTYTRANGGAGQGFVFSTTLSSATLCSGAATQILESSCSGAVLSVFAPVMTSNAWQLTNAGSFLYP